VHARSLLALACIAIVGLSTAVVLLATRSSVTPVGVTKAGVSSSAATTADAGARLDHRGLHDAAYLSGLAETGARLDHRGVRPNPDQLGAQPSLAQSGSISKVSAPVRPNPDELGAQPSLAQSGLIGNVSAPVRPNPDELGAQPSLAQSGPGSNYPGHF
jgi:hypothetical protein